jgi:hypothetical protein
MVGTILFPDTNCEKFINLSYGVIFIGLGQSARSLTILMLTVTKKEVPEKQINPNKLLSVYVQ